MHCIIGKEWHNDMAAQEQSSDDGSKKRIAFLTPEYPTDSATRGGLGSYLDRIAHALKEDGHTSEIFVLSNKLPATSEHDGILVHRVPISKFMFVRALIQIGRSFFRKLGGAADGPLYYLLSGYRLAQAVTRHNARNPYDIIHTSNLEASALFLPRRLRTKRVLRASSKRDVWAKEDGLYGIRTKLVALIETYMVRKVGRVYTSSEFLAKLHERDAKIPIAVIRPPLESGMHTHRQEDTVELPTLPPRYLVHIAGKFGPRKGTGIIFQALDSVCERYSDFTMLFIGAGSLPTKYQDDSRIRTLGPQPRPIVYHVLKGALASVVPSTAETLPNTAIDSLMCKTPVIGTIGSSIEELVVDGENGKLIPQNNVPSMVDALIFAWEGKLSFRESSSATLEAMVPSVAARNVIAFATDAKS